MKLWLRTLVLLAISLGGWGIVQAQETETIGSRDGLLLRDDAKEAPWFVVRQDKPATTQKPRTTDSYVFPDADRRFHRYIMNTVGPLSLLKSAAGAGISQWDDHPLEWGQGAKGYGKRLASHVGSNAIRQSVAYGLSEALRLDTGFERSKRKGFWPRFSDALVQNVTSRTKSGKRVISVPILVGAYTGSIIAAETWYPSRYTYKDGLRSGSYSLAVGFGLNVVREFVFSW